MEIKGRNIMTGLPKTVKLTSEEVRAALKDATGQIVETVHGVLEKTPPELAADIVDRGIVLTGGGALLRGMDTLIERKTGVSTLTVQNAMSVVAVGTGKYAEVRAKWKSKMSESVTGYIDHIIFRNEDNGYTVLVLKGTEATMRN